MPQRLYPINLNTTATGESGAGKRKFPENAAGYQNWGDRHYPTWAIGHSNAPEFLTHTGGPQEIIVQQGDLDSGDAVSTNSQYCGGVGWLINISEIPITEIHSQGSLDLYVSVGESSNLIEDDLLEDPQLLVGPAIQRWAANTLFTPATAKASPEYALHWLPARLDTVSEFHR